MSSVTATLTQHPVGQGGMMSGLLEIPDGRFHWVYDCGSNQKEALYCEIAKVAVNGEIDCLFLSHLDSDHVNGIDRLLIATGVKEVVLPYLNDIDRVVAAAHDHAAGLLTGDFLAFLSDIEGWFGARGVDRLTYITPNDDGDDGERGGPDLPRLDGGGEGPIRPKWWGVDETPPVTPTLREKGRTPLTVQRLETTIPLTLSAAGRMMDWLLLPYAHRPSDAKLFAFREALEKAFGPMEILNLNVLMSERTSREIIRDCYDLIWSDHNLVSMALYVGPRESQHWQGSCVGKPPWWPHYYETNAVGWLGTGDMHLNAGRRRRAFIYHYRDVLDQINVFGLPHHGSHRNFHDSLLNELTNMVQCVAAAGPNGYGHPNDSVQHSVHSSGKEFVHVSDEGHSVLRWRHSR